MSFIPELLAPAGTPEALRAAISAGADAVYFGTSGYNARMNAKNFTGDETGRAIELCHAHGVRVHITLNTQIYDRELADVLRCAEQLYRYGADALIVADLGAEGLIHKYFPEMELHASTQCSGASVRDAEYLSSLGFSRMVCARELSGEDIAGLVRSSPIEIEMFVHGALCVSASGQCLFSSLLGGRSGNRGECAQPCRLHYNGEYPLSPKDLCLAGHMKEIIGTGVASLKIEGRMKSPDYVYSVVSLYRRLLDEGRDADAEEIKSLAAVFSRSGFTDAYFTRAVKKTPNSMLGVRTEADKAETRAAEVTIPELRSVPIERVSAVLRLGEPARLSFSSGGRTVTVTGVVPEAARTMPLSADDVKARLSKLGGTPFCVNKATEFDIAVDGDVIMPVSAINELRRRGVSALTGVGRRDARLPDDPVPVREVIKTPAAIRTAEFLHSSQISERAREYFDTVYLPLEVYDGVADGFIMPPVVYDREAEDVRRMAVDAAARGARACIIANAGQMKLIEGLPLHVTAGFRYNICNTESALAASAYGADIVTVSPELSGRQIRDIAMHVRAAAIVYGRVPLMITERCIIRSVSGDKCICGDTPVLLRDRRGVGFPMYRAYGCRTAIYNSVPVYMADKKGDTSQLLCAAHHFIFTDERRGEVDGIIARYEGGVPSDGPMRRIR